MSPGTNSYCFRAVFLLIPVLGPPSSIEAARYGKISHIRQTQLISDNGLLGIASRSNKRIATGHFSSGRNFSVFRIFKA